MLSLYSWCNRCSWKNSAVKLQRDTVKVSGWKIIENMGTDHARAAQELSKVSRLNVLVVLPVLRTTKLRLTSWRLNKRKTAAEENLYSAWGIIIISMLVFNVTVWPTIHGTLKMGDQYYFSIIYHINYYVWCTDKITYMSSVHLLACISVCLIIQAGSLQ